MTIAHYWIVRHPRDAHSYLAPISSLRMWAHGEMLAERFATREEAENAADIVNGRLVERSELSEPDALRLAAAI